MASSPKKKKRFHGRSLTSLILALSFVVMTVSGVVLYLAPPGGQARAAGWQYLGLGRDGWMAQHITSCTVFLAASLVHLYLNIKPLWRYVYSRTIGGLHRKRELLAAIVLVGFMVVGTVYEVPPWSYLIEGSRHMRGYRGGAGHGDGRGRGGQGGGGERDRGPHYRGQGRGDGWRGGWGLPDPLPEGARTPDSGG